MNVIRFFLFIFLLASNSLFALTIEYSGAYFDPELSGDSKWQLIESQASPSLSLDLGVVRYASAYQRFLELRISSDVNTNLQFSGLGAGITWVTVPPVSLQAGKSTVLKLEIQSGVVGKKFSDLQIKSSASNTVHSLKFLYEVK